MRRQTQSLIVNASRLYYYGAREATSREKNYLVRTRNFLVGTRCYHRVNEQPSRHVVRMIECARDSIYSALSRAH